jgi:septum formation protein
MGHDLGNTVDDLCNFQVFLIMLIDKLENRQLILGSASPRRRMLMEGLNIPFTIMVKEVDENVSEEMNGIETACHIAQLKASVFENDLKDPSIVLLTADTVVWHNGVHLAKPSGPDDAYSMIEKLAGDVHEVITGVCLTSAEKQAVFHSITKVWFVELSPEEIRYYIENFKPFDKAGAYGVQEWIGHIGISKIEGSYYNVVGLPVQQVYHELLRFLD